MIASATYNNGIFTPMETVLTDLKAHNLQNRTVAVIENGSWAPQAGKLIRACFEGMKNITVLEQGVTLKSSVKEEQRAAGGTGGPVGRRHSGINIRISTSPCRGLLWIAQGTSVLCL